MITHGIRGVLTASHQPSLYMARLPMVSKYCWVWRSGAAASVSESAKVTPWKGSCSIPSTWEGAGIPVMSRIVGPTSMAWVKCERSAPPSVIRAGQWMTIGLRVPPRCEPTCLPHWNGVLPAHAHAAE